MIGIIGGMGPMATIKFCKEILKLSNVCKDQNNIPLLIYNDSRIPDRTESIFNNDNKVKKYLVDIAKKLEKNKCIQIVMPCNTAHYWANDIQNSVNIPFINMIDETMVHVKNKNYKSFGLLSTKGTIETKIYENNLSKYNLEIKYPNNEDINKISNIIYSIKSNDIDKKQKYDLIKIIEKMNTDCIVLGCTELPLILKKSNYIIDPMNVLASTIVKTYKENI